MAISNNGFSLTLDTLAPSGSITRPAQYVNAQTTCTITKGDATYMCAWFDDKAAGTLPTTPTWVAAASSVKSNFSADGVYYGHVCLMDDVNNKSVVYNTASITYDVTPPVVKTVVLDGGAEITKTRNINIEFSFSDTLSKAVSYTLSGDLNDSVTKTGTLSAAEISAGKATRSIVLSGSGEEDVTKTVGVTVTDNAGNTSTKVEDSIILDTQFLTGNIVLRDKNDTKNIINTWVNTQDLIVRLSLGAATSDDVVGYKVWGDINDNGGATATTEPASYTSVTKGTNPINVAKKLTSGDAATKTVYAKVIDDAGNETTLTAVATKYDATAPTGVTIVLASGASQYVSKVDGHKTTTLNLAANCDIAGMKSWSVTMNNAQYPSASGTATDFPATLTVSSANMATEGEKISYEFKLTVEDNAGNKTTSAGLVIYLDTVAPKNGSITMPAWLNRDDADHTPYPAFSGAGATASVEDAGAGMATMQCWVSTTADDTTPAGTAVAYAANPTHAQINWDRHAESASNYMHIKYVDNVGNAKIYHSAAFGIDTVVPADGAVAFTKDAYPSTSAKVTLTYTDATSGVAKYKIWGGVTSAATEAAAEWQDVVTSEIPVTLTTGDGIKTAYVKYKDVAGNYSVKAVSDTTELDTSFPSGSLTLCDVGTEKQVDNIRNIATMDAHIAYTDDALGGVQYKIYGDFTFDAQAAAGIDESDAKWQAFPASETGKQYALIDDMFCTSGDGTKTVYIKVKDNAGNVSDPISASFEYDTTAPTVEISGVDYNRISKVNELRRNSSGTIAGKFADETNFVFTPDSKIQAYKVCAYLNQAAVEAGSAANAAIPTTAGSIHMSATGLDSNAAVSAMIKGADYEAALGEVGKVDGAHFVVVYVLDLGGTWSTKAVFEV